MQVQDPVSVQEITLAEGKRTQVIKLRTREECRALIRVIALASSALPDDGEGALLLMADAPKPQGTYPSPDVFRAHAPSCRCLDCVASRVVKTAAEQAYPDEPDDVYILTPAGAAALDDDETRAPCDALEFGSAPTMVDGRCRCIICARCGHHTGNSHQGHYWAACAVTKGLRDFHFCCPDPAFGCSLDAADAPHHWEPGETPCHDQDEEGGTELWLCTAQQGHGGPEHVAYGDDGEPVRRWPMHRHDPEAVCGATRASDGLRCDLPPGHATDPLDGRDHEAWKGVDCMALWTDKECAAPESSHP